MAEPKTVAVTPEVHEYLVAHGTPPDAVQRALIEATGALGAVSGMQIAPEQGAFMTMLTQLVDARFAVEVGTFTGYSAICVARGLARRRPAAVPRRERGVDGHRPRALGRRPAWPTASSCGSARPPTRCRAAGGPAHRHRLHRRRQARLPHLLRRDRRPAPPRRPGPARQRAVGRRRRRRRATRSENTVAIRAVNDHVAADPRVDAVMLPISDGLTIARKH